MRIRPLFITFEGIDGAGKSSHVQWFAETLRARGIKVTVTREPGGTKIGEVWREHLLREPLLKETQTLLMFAARNEHVKQVIRPALNRGEWVLCDRFTDATRAYQGGGHGVPEAVIDALAAFVHGDCMPDKTILFNVPISVARHRLERDERLHDRKLDVFESEPQNFAARVHAAYLKLAEKDPARFYVLDSTKPENDVRNALLNFIDGYFESL
ncbi:MAG: dTMP kinase [Burkholderiales bacterium]|jgi:dTMP kinase|nr:dTMP kinase [Burkholderiales bacterium]